jgi:hypothetical protein
MKTALLIAVLGGLAAGACVLGGEAPPPAEVAKGTWTEIKVGWGHRGALALDRLSGNLFAAAWRSRGILASSDLGKTFTRADGNCAAGNPFSAYSLFAAADGGKIAAFSSQAGTLSGHSLDGGKTWTSWAKVGAMGLDYGAIDWDSGAILAMPHEEYKAYYSPDLGKTWSKLQLDYPGGTNKPHQVGKHQHYQPGVGAFGAAELVFSDDCIKRSEDAGKTWAKVADYCCQGPVQVFKGTGYWLAKKEEEGKWSGVLLATKDKGKSWTPVGSPIDNGASTYLTVPRFGKDEKHILAAAAAGIVESTDGGATWKVAVRYPEAVKLSSPFVDTGDCFEYDPARDAFYMFFFAEGPRTWVYPR